MKYKFLYKDIIKNQFIGLLILCGSYFLAFSSAYIFLTNDILSIDTIFKVIITDFYESKSIFFMLVFFFLSVNISFLYIRKDYWLGVHSVDIIDDFFVYSGKNQEIRTSLKKLKQVSVKHKYFTIKFYGIKKLKITKKMSMSGYDDFVEHLTLYAKKNNIDLK